MQNRVIITCAVTGNLATREHHPALPASPEEIAQACIDAADAGAAIAHIHVRDPETAAPSMSLEFYTEVVERLRAARPSLILNLTTGPGGRYVPDERDPAVAAPGTTLMAPERRVEHITVLKPEICTLDLNTMNSGGQVVINTPRNVRIMARLIREAGVKPELELFDTGDIALAMDLLRDGTLEEPALCSIVTGVKYGLPATADALATAARMLPRHCAWTGFGIGRMAFPMLVQSWLLGGHVRIGMEDTSHIARGRLTRGNGELTAHARSLIEMLGGEIASPEEAREMLGLAR